MRPEGLSRLEWPKAVSVGIVLVMLIYTEEKWMAPFPGLGPGLFKTIRK